MIKSTFFKGAVAVLAAMPIAAAATFTPAGSAQAAVLTGGATFASAADGDSDITTVLASDGSIKFSVPNLVGLAAKTGTFVPFTRATIYDIDPIPGAFDPAKLFLDFGTVAQVGSLTDGKNIFKAKSVSEYQISTDGGTGSSIALAFRGYFFGEDETEKSKGIVNLNFTSMMSVATVTDILKNGGATINGQFVTELETAFSGMVATTVPEPATLLGLGVVAAGMAVSRRRKTIPQ